MPHLDPEGQSGGCRQQQEEQVCSLLPCSLQDKFEEDVLDTVDALCKDRNEVSLRCQSQAFMLSHSSLLSLDFGAAMIHAALLSGGG